MERLSELLEEGFALHEALVFLQVMMEKERENIGVMLKGLENGKPFPDLLFEWGFPESVIVQLHLSLLHGRFSETLAFCGDHLKQKQEQWKKLKKAAIYPSFLLLFAFSMLFAIRSFLLPVMESSFSGKESQRDPLLGSLFFLVAYLPYLLCGIFFFCAGILYVVKNNLKKKDAVRQAAFLSRLPILGNWTKDYCTFFFSRELAYFYLNGQSLQQILTIFQSEESSALMRQAALQMEEALKNGEDLKKVIRSFPFFRPELSWMIYQGELTSQVGTKLRFYSQECHRSLLEDIERKINLLQPILFAVIGLVVVFVYAVLMLPMLNMMGGIYE